MIDAGLTGPAPAAVITCVGGPRDGGVHEVPAHAAPKMIPQSWYALERDGGRWVYRYHTMPLPVAPRPNPE